MLIDLCQSFLDEVSHAVLTGDFARYQPKMCLPIYLVSEHGSTMVHSLEDLHEGFVAYHNALKSQQVTNLVRMAESAVQLTPTLINCNYTTHAVRGGTWVAAPHQSQLVLRHTGDRWQTTCVINSFFSTALIEPPSKSLRKLQSPLALREKSEST